MPERHPPDHDDGSACESREARSRYGRLFELFERARALDGAERAAFVRAASGEDEHTRREIEALLEADAADDDGPFSEDELQRGRAELERLVEGAEEALPAVANDWVPERVGSYRVLDRIGSGGMGVVFEAEQSSPLRRVALKLIHPGQLTPERVQRFEREARILARLHHPGIAQVYEAGSFDAGRGPQPYYAMELIDGVDLRTYSDRQRLDVPARLELIAVVCDAVHHAHRAGIVHRDLKPENVLVDESGRPKILDFGVAFTAEGSTLLSTMVTEEGRILGTLAYMAPEQLDGSRREITPRADVYALGVMAFELLAGELPLDPTGLPLAAGMQFVATQEPKRLGTADRRLRGDVETIVGKALEKDVERRYESAEAFAADIRRYLSDQPIAARPPSASYRARKFARRHKGFVATLVVLVLGVVSSTVFASVASQRRSEADRLGDELDQSLYFAHMQLASSAAHEPASTPFTRELLERWRAVDGQEDRRGFEWYLLDALTRADETVLPGDQPLTALRWHPERDLAITGEMGARVYDAARDAFVANLVNDFEVHEIAWSPSGAHVAVLGPNDVAIHAVDTWRRLAHFQVESGGMGAAWHPNGSHLVTIGRDGSVRRIDARDWTRELVHRDVDLFGVEGLCAYHPSGAYLVVATERRNSARTLDARTFEKGPPLPFADDLGNNITALAFAPDGARLAAASSRGTVEIWRTEDWDREHVLAGHERFVTDVAWTRDGSQLATSSTDGSVQVFDVATGRRVRLLGGHTASVENVAWRPSDGALASCAKDGTVRIWPDEASSAAWIDRGRAGAFTSDASAAFGPNDAHVAIDTGLGIEIRRCEGGRAPTTLELHAGAFVEWRSDGRFVAWREGDELVVHDWAAREEYARLSVGPLTGYGAHLAWNPSRPDLLALGDGMHLRIVDLSGDPSVVIVPFDDGIVRDVDWIRDGAELLVASTDGSTCRLNVVDLDDDHRLRPGPVIAGVDVLDVDVAADGERVAIGLTDTTVRVLALDDWREVYALKGHVNRVRSVACSPDGTRIATASADRTVRLWETEQGRLTATLELDTRAQVVVWSGDGQRLLVMGDDTSVRIWSARSAFGRR